MAEENLDEKIKDEKIEEEILEEADEKVEKEENRDNDVNQEIEKLKNSLTRLQADFANYKRRNEKEKQDIYKYASESLIIKLLNISDNFDRALKDVEEENSFVEGLKMIKDELDSVLEKEGVEEIESDNTRFDANLHHAVFAEESDDVEENHILETFQKGYKLKDKVIRPAMVKVSK